MTQSANKPFEENVTDRITDTEIPQKTPRKLSRADEAVTETETEMESLTAEINGLEQRLNEVTAQSRPHISLRVHKLLFVTQPAHVEMNI